MDKLYDALSYVKSKINIIPKIGIVLGSGLGEFVNMISNSVKIPYKDIPSFPVSTVKGHEGCFIAGYIENVPVIVMQGRVHYYEGYQMTDVVMPVRIMGLLGAKTVILTNAAGGINQNFKQGDFMVIKDHISCFVPSPLRGENYDDLGTRFPDMTEVYNKDLIDLIKFVSKELEIELKEGIYLQAAGPEYETPAEINAYKVLGADAVGMSTACEAKALRHLGVKVLGLSLITNMAAGISKEKLSHEEVKLTAEKSSKIFKKLLYDTIIKIGEQND